MKNRFEAFTTSIIKINKNIHKIKTEEMARFNLKANHVSCLYYLYGYQKLTSKELCELCVEDKAAISRTLESLEKSEYIVCKSNASKRYNALFSLSSKGLEVASAISERINKVLNDASMGLSLENRDILYKSLELISKNLIKISENYEEK